jgi:hypothetical protein
VLRDGPDAHALPCPFPPPGPFAEAEFSVLFPHLNNHSQPVQPTAMPAPGSPLISTGFPVPTVGLDATVSPRILIGYRLPNAGGDVSVAYRLISSPGRGSVTDYALGPADLTTRLNLNQVDLNYGSDEPSLFPWGKMRWEFGSRIANLYEDERVRGPGQPLMSSQSFTGAGVDAALHLAAPVRPNLELYSRAEAAFLVGNSTERFRITGDSLSVHEVAGVVSTGVQAGLRWSPPTMPGSQLLCGYHFVQWANLVDQSANTDFTAHGLFLRWDWKY